MNTQEIQVSFEPTPNPQSMKFNFDRAVSAGQQHFDDPQSCQISPLAHKLFGFPWAEAVYIDKSFVTVTKQDWVEWDVIASPLAQLIKEHIDEGGEVLLDSAPMPSNNSPSESTTSDIDPNDPPVVQKIKEVLNNEIRPAVAMDGGDVTFANFENGIVSVHLRGACSGCPCAEMTLKQGIEVRLKEVIPEITEVISV